MAFQRAKSTISKIKPTVNLSIEERIALQIKEDERIMKNPKMRAIIEQQTAEAKKRDTDPSYVPSPWKPDFTKPLEEAEKSREHSAW